jgi:hypothetical protein
MNEAISRRKLLLLVGLGASIALPATAVLLRASDAEAQQADQAAPAETTPKKKTKKKKGTAGTTAAPPAKPKAQ